MRKQCVYIALVEVVKVAWEIESHICCKGSKAGVGVGRGEAWGTSARNSYLRK